MESNSIERLNEELIFEILSRLPVKFVAQSKCVSKRWCSLISEPKFAKIQLQRATIGNPTSIQRIIKGGYLQTINYEPLDDGEHDRLMVQLNPPETDPYDYETVDVGEYNSTIVQLHTPRKDPYDWFMLVGSCDGLVCLSCDGGYMLYNPTTRQSRIIPKSNLIIQDFDTVFHGFGYDPATDDYKILQGVYVISGDGYKEAAMEIFALKPSSWRRIPNGRVAAPYESGIYLNGAVHWLEEPGIHSKRVCKIVSFDLAEEKFMEVLPLPDVDPDVRLGRLGVHGARLFTYELEWDYCKAWVMNEYGKKESWTELFNVSIEVVLPSKYWAIPLCYTKNRKIVFNVDGRELFLFNSDENTLKIIPIHDADWEHATIYVESLVSPYVGCHDG